MKRAGILKGVAAWLALASLCLSQPLLAAGGLDTQRVNDVTLRDGGLLIGQVVDPQGIGRANVPVALLAGQRELGVGKTDQNGYFAFSGLKGGVYQIQSGTGEQAFRVWTSETAPPTARPGALVVDGKEVVRGVFERARFYLSDPRVFVPLTAAAVGVTAAVIIINNPASP
jgi:hypothetical protein